MKVRIDEGRANEIPACVQFAFCGETQRWLKRDDSTGINGDVNAFGLPRQTRVTN